MMPSPYGVWHSRRGVAWHVDESGGWDTHTHVAADAVRTVKAEDIRGARQKDRSNTPACANMGSAPAVATVATEEAVVGGGEGWW
jgi:hypothetical protein